MTKVQKIISQSAKITQELSRLKSNKIYSSVIGDYKGYKQASKEYAELAKDNFELSQKALGPRVKNVPLFSKIGMRILKVWFLDKFRIKTPAEKELNKMLKLEKAKKSFNSLKKSQQ